jgi:hypothetical protein
MPYRCTRRVDTRRDEGSGQYEAIRRGGTRPGEDEHLPNLQGTRTRTAQDRSAPRGLNFGVDYRHAVEFSRNSRTPKPGSLDPARGQPPNCTLRSSVVNGLGTLSIPGPRTDHSPQAAANGDDMCVGSDRGTVHHWCPLLPIGRRDATLRHRNEAMQIAPGTCHRRPCGRGSRASHAARATRMSQDPGRRGRRAGGKIGRLIAQSRRRRQPACRVAGRATGGGGGHRGRGPHPGR